MKPAPVFLSALVLACLAYTQPQSLDRKPYVQNVTENSATILWTTRAMTAGEVRHSSDGVTWARQLAHVRRLGTGETGLDYVIYQHQADLSGLTPGTTYRYRVLADGLDVLPGAPPEDMRLRTAAPLSNFSFLVLGDSGDGTIGQAALAERMFRTGDPDFVLHTGDLAYENGTFREYEDFYLRVYWPLMRRTPVFPAPGNHDYNFLAGAPFRTIHVLPEATVPEAGRGRYYSFNWGNAHFVALDTNAPFTEALNGQGEMLRWLDADLAATAQLWRIVYFHHTPFPTAAHRFDPVCAEALAVLTPILERHQVQLVLNGHEHIYQRAQPRRDGRFVSARGVVYVTTGGGAERTYAGGGDPYVAVASGLSHFLSITVNGPSMRITALTAQGELLDDFELQASPQIDAVHPPDSTGPVASGGLAQVSGWNLSQGSAVARTPPWPAELSGVTVTVGSLPAALQSVSRSRLLLQLPYGLSGSNPVVLRNAAGTVSGTFVMQDVAPLLLRVSTAERTSPALTRLDGSLVSVQSPARAGDILTAWMTGLGPVSPPTPAGAATTASDLNRTLTPVRVFVGETEAVVPFAGLAPTMPGVYQVNFRVPPLLSGTQVLRIVAGTSSVQEALPLAPLP